MAAKRNKKTGQFMKGKSSKKSTPRKANPAKRARYADGRFKPAVGRKRNPSNPKHKSPAKRSTRSKAGSHAKSAPRYADGRFKPSGRKNAMTKYTSNPNGLAGAVKGFKVMDIAREALTIGVITAPVLFGANWLASREWGGKDAAGRPVTLQARLGPFFNIAFDLIGLFLTTTKFWSKGMLKQWRPQTQTILGTLLGIHTLQLVTFAARRQWSFREEKLLNPGSPQYPAWTDMLALRAPQPYAAGPMRGALTGHTGGLGCPDCGGACQMGLGAHQAIDLVRDPRTGQYVPANAAV